ncbi:MAG: precorrin-6y C5,15-methyltransferase (decarboxylating) subunit CbiE [Desulfobacterales bacterium]|nr:precorrin-6y C5,15-methyltransferase (decarboxylating) subunit CbiE [Desulfobacterales bacterium]
MKKIAVIGMGLTPEDLTNKHLAVIKEADILVGGKRHLSYFEDHQGIKKTIGKDLTGVLNFIKARMGQQSVVVLASGDPLYYGIGHYLTKFIDSEYIDVYPNISVVSAAFSRLKESWQDAYVISMHGRQDEEELRTALAEKDKIAVLTDTKRDPAWLARRLTQMRAAEFSMCVLEQIGTPSEQVNWHEISKAATLKYADPNLVVLKRKKEISDLDHESQVTDHKLKTENRKSQVENLSTGMPDHLFKHDQGIITKSEVRAVAISKLRLEPGQIFWDLGAGSGSVSIEASLFIKSGGIYAVEKNPERIEQIEQNKKFFKIENLKIIRANLPEKMKELPRPDRVFIGGGGKKLKKITESACSYIKPKGVIVINTVLLSSINAAMTALERSGFSTDIVQVQISRGRKMPWGERMESLNPVWIISGEKK